MSEETPTHGAEYVRQNWRDVLDAAQQGEATIVTRHGKETAVIVPWPTWKERITNGQKKMK